MVRIPELDGLRGVAILLVLIHHFMWIPGPVVPFAFLVKFGWVGVDLFFVLSGFLITRILLNAKGGPHFFRTFYTNRALRIAPLYFCFLLAAFPFVPHSEFAAYWFFLSNFLNAAGHSIPSMAHFWSLAIEEQFYAVWPLIVLRLSCDRLTKLCVWTILLVFTLRFATVHFPLPSSEFVYKFTPLRCDPLLFGALIACLWYRNLLPQFAWTLKWAALAGALLTAYAVWRGGSVGFQSPFMERYGYLGTGLFFTAIVGICVAYTGDRALAPARGKFLRFFGKYSYAIYIFNFPIALVLCRPMAERLKPIWAALGSLVIGTALSCALALISWNLIEKRCLRLRHRISAMDVKPRGAVHCEL